MKTLPFVLELVNRSTYCLSGTKLRPLMLLNTQLAFGSVLNSLEEIVPCQRTAPFQLVRSVAVMV